MIQKMDDTSWQAMLNVHLTANFRIIKALEKYMRGAAKREKEAAATAPSTIVCKTEREGVARRSIVIVSSTVGIHGNAGQANYSAAKAGVVGLVKSIAKEWGQFQIRCNASRAQWTCTAYLKNNLFV